MSTISTTDAATGLTERFDGPGAMPAPSLLIVEPVRTQPGVSPFPLDGRKWVVGSDAECTVRLPHDGVQSRHCLILHGPQGPILKAWDHRTWVNDRPVRESPLRDGDRLAVGPVVLRVRKVALDEWQEVSGNEFGGSAFVGTGRGAVADPASHPITRQTAEPVTPAQNIERSVVAPTVEAEVAVATRSHDAAANSAVEATRARLARRMADLRGRRHELAARQREIEQAGTRLSEREAELARLAETASNLPSTVADLEERAQRLSRTEAELETAAAELEKRNRELTRAMEQAEAARSLAAELRTGIERKRSLMTDLADELLRQQATVETGRKALEHDRASSSLLRTELERRQAEIAAREQSLTSRLSDLTTRESVAESARVELGRKEQTLRELEQSVQEEIRRAELTLATADERVANVDTRLAEIDEEQRRYLAARDAERAEQNRLLDEAKTALAAEVAALEQTREALRQRETELAARDAELARRVERIEADQRELSEHADRLAGEADELSTRAAALDERSRELDGQQQTIDRIRDELSAETLRHSRVEQEFAALRNELKGLELNLSDRTGALDAREAELARRAAEVADRETRNAEESSSLAIKERDVEAAAARAAGLLAETQARDAELEARQVELDSLSARLRTRDEELGVAGRFHRERDDEHTRRTEDVTRREADLAARLLALEEDERLMRARSESLASRERNLIEAEERVEPALREAERHREEARSEVERLETDRQALDEQGRDLQLLREEIEHGTARLTAEEERLFERERELRDREDACDERLDDLQRREAAIDREARALDEARLAESASAVVSPAPLVATYPSAEQTEELARRDEELARRQEELESREQMLSADRATMDQRADELRLESERLAAEAGELETVRAELVRREGELSAESRQVRDADEALKDTRSSMDERAAELAAREAELRERESQLEAERIELDQRRQSLQAIAALVEEAPEAASVMPVQAGGELSLTTDLPGMADGSAGEVASLLESDPSQAAFVVEPKATPVEATADAHSDALVADSHTALDQPEMGGTDDDDWDHAPVDLPTWQPEETAIADVADTAAPVVPRLSIDAEVRRDLFEELDRPLLDLPDVLDSAQFTPDPGTGDFVRTPQWDDIDAHANESLGEAIAPDSDGSVADDATVPGDDASSGWQAASEQPTTSEGTDERTTPASEWSPTGSGLSSESLSAPAFDAGLSPIYDSESFAADLDRRLRQEDERIRELEQKWDSGERLEQVTRLIGEPGGGDVGDRTIAAASESEIPDETQSLESSDNSTDGACEVSVEETEAQVEEATETAVALAEPPAHSSVGSTSVLGDIAREDLFGELDLGVDTETLLGEAIALDREPEVPVAPEMDAFTDDLALRLGLMDSTPQQIADAARQSYGEDTTRHINDAAKAARKAARAASQAAKATNEVVKVASEVLRNRSDELDQRDIEGEHGGFAAGYASGYAGGYAGGQAGSGTTGGGTTVLGGAVIVPGGAWPAGNITPATADGVPAVDGGDVVDMQSDGLPTLPSAGGGGGTVIVGGPWTGSPVMGTSLAGLSQSPVVSVPTLLAGQFAGAPVVEGVTAVDGAGAFDAQRMGVSTPPTMSGTGGTAMVGVPWVGGPVMGTSLAGLSQSPVGASDTLEGLQQAVGKLTDLVAQRLPVDTPPGEEPRSGGEPRSSGEAPGALFSMSDIESLVQQKVEPKPAPKILTQEESENPKEVRSLLAEMFGIKDLQSTPESDGSVDAAAGDAPSGDSVAEESGTNPEVNDDDSEATVEETESPTEPAAEESISDYMERLLARNRKGGGGAAAPSSSAKPAASESRLLPAKQTRVEDLDLSQVTGGTKSEEESEPAPPPVPRERVNPEELRVRHEFLRELANQSARQALALYRERQQRTGRYFKGATCAAGLGLATFVLGGFSGVGGLQAIHGWVALGVAGFMGASLGVDIRGLRKMQARAKGKQHAAGPDAAASPELDDSLVIVEYDE
jgi:chromosome segregation ATPase/pSer/pThr/pTyr-binding forkhead associated (FHA) protein